MVDPDNTVFFDIHTESAVTGVTLEIDHLQSETGMFRHTDGKLYIAAIINYPGYGHIWHVVTDVCEHALIWQEPEGEVNTFFRCAVHPHTTVSVRGNSYYCPDCRCTPGQVIGS